MREQSPPSDLGQYFLTSRKEELMKHSIHGAMWTRNLISRPFHIVILHTTASWNIISDDNYTCWPIFWLMRTFYLTQNGQILDWRVEAVGPTVKKWHLNATGKLSDSMSVHLLTNAPLFRMKKNCLAPFEQIWPSTSANTTQFCFRPFWRLSTLFWSVTGLNWNLWDDTKADLSHYYKCICGQCCFYPISR